MIWEDIPARCHARLKPSKGTRHRKPISINKMRAAAQLMQTSLPGEGGRIAAAAVHMGFFGILRANEALHPTPRDWSWKVNKARQLTIKGRISDKTHASRSRTVVIPVSEDWKHLAQAWINRLEACKKAPRRGRLSLLTSVERKTIKSCMKPFQKGPGNLRPGGNMYWLQQGLNSALIHKQGGWAPNSSVPARHYTSVNKWGEQQMRSKIHRIK